MKVARGDQKRRHEAMRSLVNDFLHNPSSEPSSVVRLAVEVSIVNRPFSFVL